MFAGRQVARPLNCGTGLTRAHHPRLGPPVGCLRAVPLLSGSPEACLMRSANGVDVAAPAPP